MSWKGSPHTSQSILDKKPKKHGHRQLKNRTHCSIQVSFTFSPPLQFWTPVCRLLLRKDPLSLFGFPWFLFLPLSLKCHIFTPSFWGILKFYYDSCFLQKDVFNCRCPADFGSILFLVVVSVWLCQLRRNSNCWICNYLSWERERRHIEWGGEVHTQGLTPPRLLKRSTKPFFHLHWNNSSARTAISTGPSFFPNDIFHNCSS